MTSPKKAWKKPELRSEEVEETLARGACSFKPPGTGGQNPRPGSPNRPQGNTPAFS